MFNYCAEAVGGVSQDVVRGFGVGGVEYLVHSGGGHDFVLIVYYMDTLDTAADIYSCWIVSDVCVECVSLSKVTD